MGNDSRCCRLNNHSVWTPDTRSEASRNLADRNRLARPKRMTGTVWYTLRAKKRVFVEETTQRLAAVNSPNVEVLCHSLRNARHMS